LQTANAGAAPHPAALSRVHLLPVNGEKGRVRSEFGRKTGRAQIGSNRSPDGRTFALRRAA